MCVCFFFFFKKFGPIGFIIHFKCELVANSYTLHPNAIYIFVFCFCHMICSLFNFISVKCVIQYHISPFVNWILWFYPFVCFNNIEPKIHPDDSGRHCKIKHNNRFMVMAIYRCCLPIGKCAKLAKSTSDGKKMSSTNDKL